MIIHQPRRLVIRPGGIGDCILSLPAIQHLRPSEVWVPSAVVPLVRFAERVRAIPDTRLDLLGLPGVDPPAALLDELSQFDSIVSWYGANRPLFQEAVASLPFRFLTALPPLGATQHAADFFFQQVGGAPPAIPHIECAAHPQGLAVIHPFSGSASKNWPLDHFREIAAALPMPVQWCAGPEETLDGATRFDDLYQLASWLSSARLYIGNDSGITHLAAAVGAPVIACFSTTDPAVWAPRGPRVQVVHTLQEALSFLQRGQFAL